MKELHTYELPEFVVVAVDPGVRSIWGERKAHA
jgi:uncharacterized protein involved in tolerance to divalent cations